MGSTSANQRINLNDTGVLLLDGNSQSLDILAQIFGGFGIKSLDRCQSSEDAIRILNRRQLDLIVTEVSLSNSGENGYDFVSFVRRSGGLNVMTPIIMTTGHTPMRDVMRARDSGANIMVAKPLKPQVLLDRIILLCTDKRSFIESDVYTGPDRRWHSIGLPPGTSGRRSTDLRGEIGAATAPNLAQTDIDSMFKPQRIGL